MQQQARRQERQQDQPQQQAWINKAALYELCAHAFLLTTKELTDALVSGEYAEALVEIGQANALDNAILKETAGEIDRYRGRDSDELFHELRTEYTHLYVGAPEPAVPPFAGVWWAREVGVEPLLFVNKESMAVERFMRSCGIGQPEGTNEPLDHVGSELEFLQYLCLLRAEAVKAPEAVETPERAYEDFYATHFSDWIRKFAHATDEASRVSFYRSVARVLLVLPQEPL
jgi:TorA maturation chaperone TorD